MARFARRPIPRRALLGATLGAAYGLILLPAPSTVLGLSAFGVAWFALSVSLLFLLPFAYHVFTAWGLLWVIWKVIGVVRTADVLGAILDVGLPLASVLLVMTSRYREAAEAWQAAREA